MDFHELIAASDPAVFTQSLSAWVSGISVNSVIMLVMMIFMLVGAVDKIRGNKLGYGEKFEEGFNTMGGLAMSMAGIRCGTDSVYATGPCSQASLWSGRCQPRHVRHNAAGLRHGGIPSGDPTGG